MLENRVSVAELQAFMSGSAVGRLQVEEGGLMDANDMLEPPNVRPSAFSKDSLGLSVPSSPILRCWVSL